MYNIRFFFLVPLRSDFESWPPFRGLAITLTGHETFGRTPLDEWSARHRRTQHSQETSMPSAGFEPAILAASRRRPKPWRARPLESV